MTILKQANHLYRTGSYFEAELLYEKILTAETHELTRKICIENILRINNMIDNEKVSPSINCIATVANSKFFNSLLKLIRDIINNNKSKSLEKIFVFNLGLEDWQKNLLTKIKQISVIEKHLSEDIDYGKYNTTDIDNLSTYFFKVAALNEIAKKAIKEFKSVNLLWLDAGNSVTRDLKTIFNIIESDGYFFIDHSDVEFIYTNPENTLASCLSPTMFENSDLNLRKPSIEDAKKPYIKANCFGIKLSSENMLSIIDKHRQICTTTNCLDVPRTISDDKKSYWNSFYNDTATSLQYKWGRHEQSVWSYLVIINNLRIRNSIPFSFTVAAGSGTINERNWERKTLQLLSKKESRYLDKKTTFGPLLNAVDADEIKQLKSKDFVTIGKRLFFGSPTFEGIGFPCPDFASASICKLDRGAYSRIDEHKYLGATLNHMQNIKEEIFILLGNGPSLAEVDLKSLEIFDTFGLNAAYRIYSKLNFWPKYFGCFDALVCDHHSDEFKKLIKDSKIERFFFINFNDSGDEIFVEPEILNSPKFQRINFSYRTQREKLRTDIFASSFDQFIDMRTSGANTIQSAILMGYRKFIMLGVDQNYIEVVDGAKKDNNYHKLIMEKTPDSNPNYWFSDYQQAGDKFNRPNLQKSQIPAWNNLSCTLETLGIKCEIYNASPITQLNAFPKKSLQESINHLMNISSQDLAAFNSPLKQNERNFVL